MMLNGNYPATRYIMCPQDVDSRLRKLETNKRKVNFLLWDILHAAPSKPVEGMEVVADGTDWDPGSGAGKYLYIGGSWTKL